ncbi:MAG: Shedu immune nuclease family protein [Flavobacteriales bacterium]
MEDEASEFDYFQNKRTDRVYLSRSLEEKSFYSDDSGETQELSRRFRIVSKVMDCLESHEFIKDGKEVVLRVTQGGRQEIKAKFYEDTRDIITLTIQKFTTQSGAPHKASFTFQNAEISKLFNFIRNVKFLPTSEPSTAKFDDDILEDIVLTREQAIELISKDPELIKEIISSSVTTSDIQYLTYRKEQLDIFERLLNDNEYFDTVKAAHTGRPSDEQVWQDFFERNTWIFGYGLSYVFNSPLEDAKLEQVVAGYSFNSSGKRVDALMKTRGAINSFCLGEIKTHRTQLLKQTGSPYRAESWAISDELAGAIAQSQRAVQKSIRGLNTKVEIKDRDGAPTGEQVFLYQPRSFVVIGHLKQFMTDVGVNEDRFSSFELFRQSQLNPEIITFDELFERARFIVRNDEMKVVGN